ncbi:hypothetical protein SAMN05444920_1229 [Nonomuraea solani]|uniref:Uncharacterized protein n=1 Tax=Nonomuraea solani TaxID=1144553 RepID=A0A1H6EV22_9ACTN|nr:hypothetical protein [Nonomuraea solani]SEH01760.1 hypothetical protein SAMN05444920_1229 [Nonomuraea solani]
MLSASARMVASVAPAGRSHQIDDERAPAILPSACLHEDGRWIWAHTGWPVEAPGQIVGPPQEFAPAPGLRWQVAVWHDLRGTEGKVLGEDYGGNTSNWQTVGWCSTRDDARLIARAYMPHRDHYARADVVEHGTDNGEVSRTVDTYLPDPDAPERPRPATAPGPRPASPHRSEIPEPAWYQRQDNPPNSSLIVWTPAGWRTLIWTNWQTGIIAQELGIGAGGPYEWAEAWGPRHPDRHLHDWTQEGRTLTHRFPEPTYEERTQFIDAARRAHEDALVDALADLRQDRPDRPRPNAPEPARRCRTRDQAPARSSTATGSIGVVVTWATRAALVIARVDVRRTRGAA